MEFFNFMLSGWTKAGDTGVVLRVLCAVKFPESRELTLLYF
jgi:hypothetical protein